MDAPGISTFADPAGDVSAPTGIIAGPDGMVWFTSIGNHRLGRIDPRAGRIETFVAPAGDVALPANIHPGGDGRLWFTSLGSDRIGRVDPDAADPAASIETFALPGGAKPVAIKPAADGRIWFSLRGADALGSLDPCARDVAASLRIVTAPGIGAPAAIFPAADGRLWFVNGSAGTIARLDPSAADPAAGLQVVAGAPVIADARAWGADGSGRVWLTVRGGTDGGDRLLGFDPLAADPGADPVVVEGSELAAPDGIWLGPDGAMWFANPGAHAIGRLDVAAALAGRPALAAYGAPPAVQDPFDIKPGPDPAELWFTDKAANRIGRLRPA